MISYDLFGPVDDALAAGITEEILVIEVVLVALVLANIVARALAHRRHVSQADDGAEALSRHPFHVFTNIGVVVMGFYYATVEYQAGMVFSTIVVVLLLTDLFEFESRKVEARREIDIERPKAAIAGSLLALAYVGYVTLFTGPLGQFL
jgi:hypothetical protein